MFAIDVRVSGKIVAQLRLAPVMEIVDRSPGGVVRAGGQDLCDIERSVGMVLPMPEEVEHGG